MKRSNDTNGAEPELPKEGSGSGHHASAPGPDGDAEISLDADGVKLASSSSSGLVERLTAHAPAQTRYVLQGEVARGGMGAILKVWDEDLRRTLAMKVILGRDKTESLGETPSVDERVLARFLEEAQVTGQLDHPGIVPVHELGLDSKGRVYFTMPLVKGRDLKEIIELVHARKEGWTETKAIGVILKVCEAMGYAHSKGVLHRDLKPANIMVGRFGQTYVMDWGLAKVIGRKDTRDIRLKKSVDAMPSLVHVERKEMVAPDSDSPLVTMDGTIVGTPAYMPPEQARGAIEEMTARSDVYAVGAMLYHLLTGEAPYVPPGTKVSPVAILNAVLEGPPKPVHAMKRGVAAELSAICERAMARDPAQRYASTLELANDLQAYLEGRVVRAYETGAVAEFKKWVDRNRGMAAAMAAAVVLLIVGLAVSSRLYLKAERSAELARSNEERADAKAIEAENNAARALESERAVRDRSYVANLRAAEFSLSVNDVADCKRNLDACPVELRGWEWRHLSLAADTSLLVIRVPKGEATTNFGTTKPKGYVTCVDFTPDGAKILTGTDAGPAQFWNLVAGEQLARLGPANLDSNKIALSPDGKLLACASQADGRVRIRSTATGEVVPHGLLPDAQVRPWTLTFSPDGKCVATAYGDATVRVWNTETNASLPDLGGRIPGALLPNALLSAVAYSRDGLRIAVGCGDGTILVWNAATGESVATLRGHEQGVSSVAFLGESSGLVSASNDKSLRFWNVDTGVCLDVLRVHEANVQCVAVSPDGSRIASAAADKTVRIWSTKTHHPIAVMHGHEKSVRSVAFSPDGTRIVSGSLDTTARVWDAETPGAMSFLREPQVTSSFEGGRAWLDARAIAFSPDARRVVAGLEDGTIQVWDPRTHAELAVLRGHTASVNSVAFSHDGTRIVSAASDRTVRVWDSATYAEVFVMREHSGQVVAAAFGPDDAWIASGSDDKTALISDAKTGAVRHTLRGHTKGIACLAVSPDGSRIVTGSHDMTVRSWDARTGAPVGAPLVHPAPVQSIACSPDGARIATSALEMVRLWRVDSDEAPVLCAGHDALVNSVVFTPDGTRLLSGSNDDTVRIWDGRTGEALFTLHAPDRDMNCLAFSPDGTRLAAATSMRTLAVWETEPLSAHAEERRAESRSIQVVQPRVDALFEDLIASADVIRKLQTDSSLEPNLREAAVRMARFRGDDPSALAAAAYRIVVEPDAEPKTYARGLRMIETAWVERPENNAYLRVLGIAQYRAGEYEKALATLVRAERQGHGVPRDIAFQAMAEQKLGRADAARKTLGQLRDVMRKKRWSDDKEAQAFSVEAEKLIAAATSPASGEK